MGHVNSVKAISNKAIKFYITLELQNHLSLI